MDLYYLRQLLNIYTLGGFSGLEGRGFSTNETEILKEIMISVIRLSGCSHTSKIRTDSITSSARASVSGMVYSRFFLKYSRLGILLAHYVV